LSLRDGSSSQEPELRSQSHRTDLVISVISDLDIIFGVQAIAILSQSHRTDLVTSDTRNRPNASTI
jgi:hypothetical protein